MHVFTYVHVIAVTCPSPPHLLRPPTPPPYPPATAPHLTPPCPALQGLSQKGMRRGTVFHPGGGQSLWISQPSLGPSPLGSGAQQAPSSPPQRTESFEMSPQTPDSGDVPLFGSGGGALMTDSIFVFVNMPRQRR